LPANRLYCDDALLPLIAAGDEQAFCLLYQQTNAGLYNAVMTYVRDTEAAREIVQQVYIRVWDSRRLLRNVRSFKDYLFILARNLVFDHIKKHTVEIRHLAEFRACAPVMDDDVLTHIQERECGRMLRQVVARLPERQREVYLLASEEEMSYDKIADRMQLSRLTVKRHLELARRFVRKNIHHYLHHEALLPLLVFFSTLLAS
jgi:RNA polymerase sigma-70 factor (ECF subfamily)